jgi:hypothetical protein
VDLSLQKIKVINMKAIICSLGLALAFWMSGCSTTQSVSTMEGKGTKQTFNAPFDHVWRAAVDAAQHDDLTVLQADRERGYISSKRGVRVHTFGENVAIWVRSLSPTSTEVEVVSRQAGPPVAWLKNWENEILRAVAANLSKEVPAVGAPTVERNVIRGDPTLLRGSETLRLDTERQVSELRAQEKLRQEELEREQDIQRREQLRTEIERVRQELRRLESRLLELETQERKLR